MSDAPSWLQTVVQQIILLFFFLRNLILTSMPKTFRYSASSETDDWDCEDSDLECGDDIHARSSPVKKRHQVEGDARPLPILSILRVDSSYSAAGATDLLPECHDLPDARSTLLSASTIGKSLAATEEVSSMTGDLYKKPRSSSRRKNRKLNVNFAPDSAGGFFSRMKSLVSHSSRDTEMNKLVEVIEYERPSLSCDPSTPLWKRRQQLGFLEEDDEDSATSNSPGAGSLTSHVSVSDLLDTMRAKKTGASPWSLPRKAASKKANTAPLPSPESSLHEGIDQRLGSEAYPSRAPSAPSSPYLGGVYGRPGSEPASPLRPLPAPGSPYLGGVDGRPGSGAASPLRALPVPASPLRALPAPASPYLAGVFGRPGSEAASPMSALAAPIPLNLKSVDQYAGRETAPSHSLPAYSPSNLKSVDQYAGRETASPSHSLPAYSPSNLKSVDQYAGRETASPSHALPAYFQSNLKSVDQYAGRETASPSYSLPAYSPKSVDHAVSETASPSHSLPAYSPSNLKSVDHVLNETVSTAESGEPRQAPWLKTSRRRQSNSVLSSTSSPRKSSPLHPAATWASPTRELPMEWDPFE